MQQAAYALLAVFSVWQAFCCQSAQQSAGSGQCLAGAAWFALQSPSSFCAGNSQRVVGLPWIVLLGSASHSHPALLT